MSELKRCFCCGSDCIYETFEIDDIGRDIPVIFCDSCKVVFKVENDSPYLNDEETYRYLKEKNIKAWNTRKPMESILEQLENAFPINPYPNEFSNGRDFGIKKAIEIVKEEARE